MGKPPLKTFGHQELAVKRREKRLQNYLAVRATERKEERI